MTRLYLHIGQPKTATTTIQTFLARNRSALLKEGWLYPNALRQYGAHHLLGNFFRDEKLYWVEKADAQQCLSELKAEVAATRCKNVILSTETLYYMPKPSQLADYFKGFDVVPVVFLRRQDEWAESVCRERLKNGVGHGNLKSYISHLGKALDYITVLDTWRKAFPAKMLVVPFEKSGSHLPVEELFLETVGADLKGEFERAEVKNETLTRDALAFYANFTEKPRIGEKHDVFKNVLAEYSSLNKDPAEAKQFLSPEMRLELIAKYADGNRRIATEFLGRENGELFLAPPPKSDEPWVPYTGLTRQKAMEIAEFMANKLYGRLEKEE